MCQVRVEHREAVVGRRAHFLLEALDVALPRVLPPWDVWGMKGRIKGKKRKKKGLVSQTLGKSRRVVSQLANRDSPNEAVCGQGASGCNLE